MSGKEVQTNKTIHRRVALAAIFTLEALLALGPVPAATSVKAQSPTDFPGTGFGQIPNSNCLGTGLTISFNVAGLTGLPTDVRVGFSGDHTWVGELDVILLAPNGWSKTIFTNTGGPSQNDGFGDSSDLGGPYNFYDTAPNNWWEAADRVGVTDPIPAGEYRTSESDGISALLTPTFESVNPNGRWRLIFTDCGSRGTGSITSANLTITAGGAVVAGRVLSPSGQPIRGASVIITDSFGNRRRATTGSFGGYVFYRVLMGGSYTVTVASRRHRFAPRVVDVAGDVLNLDLTGLE